LIQGTALVAVVVGAGVGVGEVTSAAMMVVVAAATVGVGLITSAVVEVHGALEEDLEVEIPDGAAAVVTITVAAVEMEAGVHLQLPLTLVVEAGEHLPLPLMLVEVGEQLLLLALVLVMTRDGAAPKRRFQHKMAEVVVGVPVVGAGEGCAVLPA
jgi:hypothetical protein